MERIGILGGTFDPPHIGHLWLAEAACQDLALNRVLFVPVGSPPHKDPLPVTQASHRLAMTRLAIANNQRFAVDTSDLTRPKPHYTVALLALLRQDHPDAEFWLLIGSDSLRDLPNWHDPSRLIRQCRLAVLLRPGARVPWESLLRAVPGVDAVVDMLSGPSIGLSSTDIRQRIAAGHSVRYLVPESVQAYAVKNHLYRHSGRRP